MRVDDRARSSRPRCSSDEAPYLGPIVSQLDDGLVQLDRRSSGSSAEPLRDALLAEAAPDERDGPRRDRRASCWPSGSGSIPTSVGPGLIARAVRRADVGARACTIATPTYQRLCQAPSDELQALVEEVVVPESWFFRDERPFALARRTRAARAGWPSPARPPLAGPEHPLRRGRGAVLDRDRAARAGPRRRRGSRSTPWTSAPGSLDAARRGRLSRRTRSGRTDLALPRPLLPRRTPRASRSTPAVRATVRFHRGNLLDPDLLAGQPPYDVIFCRNLLIYLDAAARRRRSRRSIACSARRASSSSATPSGSAI